MRAGDDSPAADDRPRRTPPNVLTTAWMASRRRLGLV